MADHLSLGNNDLIRRAEYIGIIGTIPDTECVAEMLYISNIIALTSRLAMVMM